MILMKLSVERASSEISVVVPAPLFRMFGNPVFRFTGDALHQGGGGFLLGAVVSGRIIFFKADDDFSPEVGLGVGPEGYNSRSHLVYKLWKPQKQGGILPEKFYGVSLGVFTLVKDHGENAPCLEKIPDKGTAFVGAIFRKAGVAPQFLDDLAEDTVL